ncbi:MAG: hypothetical protein ACLPN1_02370 [Dissulfurispiraceae bacterium]|jgi:hypothetical protein
MAVDEVDEIMILKEEIKRLREQLNRLTPSLSVMLRRRGFNIYRKEPTADLIVPDKQFIDGFYEMLKKYSFRLFLRDVIKYQPLFTLGQVTRYATQEVTFEYVRYLVRIGMLMPEGENFRLQKGLIKSFGSTLEWFVAEIFCREFSAETIWGAKMKNRAVGGDYDLLSRIEGAIVYMEIKSSPPRQIYQNEISSFFERAGDLMPEMAIFFIDTELRMKDKIVPMFEHELKNRYENHPAVVRMERELFEVPTQVTNGPKMFIINAKDSVITNIEKVLVRHFRGEA